MCLGMSPLKILRFHRLRAKRWVYLRVNVSVLVAPVRSVSPGGLLSAPSLHARILHGHQALSQGTVSAAASALHLLLGFLLELWNWGPACCKRCLCERGSSDVTVGPVWFGYRSKPWPTPSPTRSTARTRSARRSRSPGLRGSRWRWEAPHTPLFSSMCQHWLLSSHPVAHIYNIVQNSH